MGIVADAFALVFVAITILTFGMETTFFRFSEKEKKSEIYATTFLIVASFAALFFVLGILFHKFFIDLIAYQEHPQLFGLMLVIIVLDILAAIPMAKLRYDEKATRFSAIYLLNIFISVAGNLYFIIILKKGIEFVFLTNVLASAIKVLFSLYKNMPHSRNINRDEIKPLLKYGGLIMLAGLAYSINEHLDKSLLPRLWHDGNFFLGKPRTGEEMNGIYSISYKLGMFITLTTQAFRYAAEPYFFKLSAEKKSNLNIARAFHYFMLAGLVVFILVSTFKEEIASFQLFGILNHPIIHESYWEGLEIVPIILMANLMSGAYVSLSIWYKITKQLKFGLLFSSVGAFITLSINFVAIQYFGYYASAWATLLCYSSMAILSYFVGQKFYPIPFKIGRIMFYILLASASYITLRFVFQTTFSETEFLISKFIVAIPTIAIIILGEKFSPVFKLNHKKN